MATNKASACRGLISSKLGKTTKTHMKGVGKHFGVEGTVNKTNPPEGWVRPDLSIPPFSPCDRPPEPKKNDSPESYKSRSKKINHQSVQHQSQKVVAISKIALLRPTP